jgi:hypothetical protein
MRLIADELAMAPLLFMHSEAFGKRWKTKWMHYDILEWNLDLERRGLSM